MLKGARAIRALAAAGFMVAGLGACSTYQIAPVPGKAEIADSLGVVVLTVTSNSPRSGQFDSVVLEQEQPGGGGWSGRYQLNQLSQGLARDTALYVGAVPPGKYRVARFNAGELFIELGEGTRERLGRLVVERGATHDLGRLVVTNLNDRVLVGRSELVKSNAELVKRYVPESAPYMGRTQGLGWMAARDPKDRVEEFALATPAGASALTELPGGEVMAVSRMGSVLVRANSGSWRRLSVQGLESLLWLHPVGDGQTRAVAVGEFNALVRVANDWTVQKLDVGDLPPGTLVFIEGDSKRGWHLVQQQRKEVTVYRSDDLEKGPWTPIHTFEGHAPLWRGQETSWAWTTEKGFAVAVAKGDVHWYDRATRTWTQTQAPRGRSIHSIQASPGGYLGMTSIPVEGLGGLFAQLHASTDQGMVWTNVTSPVSITHYPTVRSASSTLFVQSGAQNAYRSRDGGVTWEKMPSSLYTTERMFATPTKGLFAVDSGSGMSGYAAIRNSVDDGATWRLEFSNYVDIPKK